MDSNIKTSCGLYLDMSAVRQVNDEMVSLNAEKHNDIVVVNGDRLVSMTVDEFIQKLGV